MKKYKLIKHWPAMPKIALGTEIGVDGDFFDKLPEFWELVDATTKRGFQIVTQSLVGPIEVKRLKDGKRFKVGDMTNFGEIKSFVVFSSNINKDAVIITDKYFCTFPVHIEALQLLEDSKTPFERYHKNVCWESAYLIGRKINRRIRLNPTSTNIKQWKDDLIWIQKWIDEHPEDSQEFGRLYRTNDTKTKIIHAFIGIRGEGKSKFQQDLIKTYKENNPEKIVVSVPAGLGKAGYSQKPLLGIIPKKEHDQNRLNDINEAINRYLEAKKDIPAEWLIEKRELENKLTK